MERLDAAYRGWKKENFAERTLWRGALAMLLLLGSLLCSLAMEPAIPQGYIVLLLGATAAAGWVGRRTLGLMAGVLTVFMAEYFFLTPTGSFLVDKAQLGQLALFGAAALRAGWSSGAWREKFDRLDENSEQYRTLLDGVRDCAVFLLDREGRIATWNSGAERIKGYKDEEVLGKSTAIFYSSEEVAQGIPKRLLEQAAERGNVRSQGWRHRKDGTRFWAEVTVTALYAGDGAVRGYAKTTRDVTELKKSKELLEAKEEELRIVVESAPDTVLMTDAEGTIIFVNDRAEAMFGYRSEELLGEKVEILVPRQHRGGHEALREGYQQKPHTRPMGVGRDLYGVRKDGSEFPVEISLSPVASAKAKRFVACVRDITRRRMAEQELEATKIQDLAQLMVRELDGRIVRWNPGIEPIYGYSRSEAEGKISHQLLKTKFPAMLEQIDAELLRNGRWEGELAHRTKAGNTIIVNSVWMLHRGKDGSSPKVLESNTDITKQKEAQRKARELNEELEKQNANLVLAKEMIEAQTQKIAVTTKMSALGEMAGGMAHEINNPMGIIHARASDLMEMAEAGEAVPAKLVVETMEKIRSTAARVSKIIMGLRKFAREARNDPATVTRMQEIVDDTLSFCLQRLKQSSVELRVAPVAASLQIACRPAEISQVLLNLLNNAVDAVQPLQEKWVELAVQDRGEEIEISVTDSGGGIPAAALEKIGQPFFTTKEVGRGTGLGLSISKGIVEAHGGRLDVDTKCEHTRFVARLPKVAALWRETVGAGK